MVDILEGPLQVEHLREASQPKLPVGQDKAQEPLSDDQVRAAIAEAESKGDNPLGLTTEALKAPEPPPPPQPAEAPKAEPPAQVAPADVPAKFQKPDGTVDEEKLKTATERLDEAIEAKTEKLKSVEDYLAEYRAKEKQLSQMPNPEKLAAKLPPMPDPVPDNPTQMSDDQLRQILQTDYAADPVGTTAKLIQIAIEKRLEPYEADKKLNQVRSNIQTLAEKDPRVLNEKVFQAITAKLNEHPEMKSLKNPHKAAWLEVKDEMRLGEYVPPGPAPAQPRPPSPILGGGAPPSVPSQTQPTQKDILASLNQLNLRDKKQEEAGDAAIRALFERR